YLSAAAMAADLAAFVEARPIGVRPTGRVERMRLWMRREPARARLALVAIVAAVALSGVVAWSVYQLPLIAVAKEIEKRGRFDELVHDGYARFAAGHPEADRSFGAALSIYPDEPIALGGLALALASQGRRREAVALLAGAPELVASQPGLAYLHEVGVDVWRRPPSADAPILENSKDSPQCFFAGPTARARALSLPLHGAN